MIASEWLGGNELGQTKQSGEHVVPLRKDELTAEELHLQMNVKTVLKTLDGSCEG